MPYPKKDIDYDFKPHDTAPRDPVTGAVTKQGFVSWIRDGLPVYRRGYPAVSRDVQVRGGEVNIPRLVTNFIEVVRHFVSNAFRLPLKHVGNVNEVERGEMWCDGDGIKYRPNVAADVIETVERMSNKGQPNGYAPLDSAGTIPLSHLPNVVETKDRLGQPNGYAPLDGNARVPLDKLPSTVEVTTHKGQANGYAPLDSETLIPRAHLRHRITTVTGNTNLSLDYHVYLCDASSAALSVFLPTSSSVTGHYFVIKKVDSSTNAVAVVPNGSETIDGQTSVSLAAQWNSIWIMSTGNGWIIMAKVM